jgi:hypothetical protein
MGQHLAPHHLCQATTHLLAHHTTQPSLQLKMQAAPQTTAARLGWYVMSALALLFWLSNIMSQYVENRNKQAEFETLTAVTVKNCSFWDVMLCSPVEIYQRFRGR